MSDWCLYPNLCGLGTDCSECYEKYVGELETRLAAAEADAARHVEIANEYMRDAERYRWLRESRVSTQRTVFLDATTTDELDAAIDAARGGDGDE